MTGNIDVDLREGLSWNAIVLITATGQPRRKVLYELGFTPDEPLLTIQLDLIDRLSAVVHSRQHRQFQTSPVNPSEFAGRPIWLQVELKPVRDHHLLTLRINGIAKGEPVSADGLAVRGDATQSIGASLTGGERATFRLAELLLAKPLSDKEQEQLGAYFSEKHKLGRT